MYRLTERQKTVLELNKQGLSQCDIALKLGLKQSTVSAHLNACALKGCDVKRYALKDNKIGVRGDSENSNDNSKSVEKRRYNLMM